MTYRSHHLAPPRAVEETMAYGAATEKVDYGWKTRDPAPAPPRRRVFPRGWQDARNAAWALAGLAAAFAFSAGGMDLLKLAVGK